MKTVVALYDTISDANAAVKDLVDYGITRDNISLMASDSSGNYSSYLSNRTTGEVTADAIDTTASGAATGAGIGALVGGLGGLLVGLGVLVIPGVGPVLAAGPLATAISAITGAGVGAMAGGAAGGLLGALVDLGLPEETAGNYAEGVRRGGTLVTVRTEDHQAEEARRIMNRHNVVNLDDRVRGWREQGWTGYNRNEDWRSTETASDINRSSRPVDSSFDRKMEDTSGMETSPYTKDSEIAGARHPEGGMYGGINTPSESGSLPPSSGDRLPHYDWQTDSTYRGYDTGFQEDFSSRYLGQGKSYDIYRPAYYYGYQLANDERYRGWTWNDLEPEARRDWDRRGVEGAWDDFKDAVQHAWNRVREGVRETFD